MFSIFKLDSVIKELRLSCKGWFSNWKIFNRVNSPVTKTTNKITNNIIVSSREDMETILLKSNVPKISGHPNMLLLPSNLPDEGDQNNGENDKILINKRIDETVALINLGRFKEAREILLTILGEIKTKNNINKELGRVYNNIGVTYNLPSKDGDYDKAYDYFSQAVSLDPNSYKAKMNLAQTLINKGNFSDGLDKIKALWSVERNSDVLQILLLGIYKNTNNPDDVFDFIKNEKDISILINESEGVNNLLAILYLEKHDFDNSLKYADAALDLSPDWPELLNTKARALLMQTQEKHKIDSEFDIVPRFDDYHDVNDAHSLFLKAKDIAEQQNKLYLLPEIMYGITTCLIWLGRYEESKYNLMLIPKNDLDEITAYHIDILNFAVNIHDKDFALAYNSLIASQKYKQIPYIEKRRLARVFLTNGAVEQSESLLNDIQVEAEQNKDIYYWLDLSTAYVLLDKQQEAISAAIKSKKMADNQDDKEIIKATYSHYNAVMFHYSKPEDGEGSETSRLISGVMEFQSIFPEEKILTPIEVQDKNGELTNEIQEIFTAAKKRFNLIKDTFKSQPLPFYFLEKIFHRPLADLITHREDPDFDIPFTGLDPQFLKENDDNFFQAESFYFDYLSLLDLSKMGFLGFIEKLGKPIYIHELLFRKIQEELLQNEISELRGLWNFLRKSKAVQFVSGKSEKQLKDEKLASVLGEWIPESMKSVLSRNSVFVTDDLRMFNYVKTEGIKPINIMVILNKWRKDGVIDEKMYSHAIGDLAERFYSFISYTADDLYEIVLEDKGKITVRSYYLIRQMFLPGSIATSFVGVFVKFIDLFWKTGSLPEEKVAWVRFLSSVIIEVIDRDMTPVKKMNVFDREAQNVVNNLKPYVLGFGSIWSCAIKNGSKDDVVELSNIVDEIFSKDYLVRAKEEAKKLIFKKLN